MLLEDIEQLLEEADKYPLSVRIAAAILQEHSNETALGMVRSLKGKAIPDPLRIAVENSIRDLAGRELGQIHRAPTPEAYAQATTRLSLLAFALRKFLPARALPATREAAPESVKPRSKPK